MSTLEPTQFLDDAWPLVVVQLPSMLNNMVAVKSLIDNYEEGYRRNEPFVSVVDCSMVTKFPGAPERKALVDWLTSEARIEKERRLTIGTVLVLTSGPMRAFAAAMNWIRRPDTPRYFASTRSEGIEWCCARLVDAGVVLSPAIGELRRRPAASAAPMRRPR